MLLYGPSPALAPAAAAGAPPKYPLDAASLPGGPYGLTPACTGVRVPGVPAGDIPLIRGAVVSGGLSCFNSTASSSKWIFLLSASPQTGIAGSSSSSASACFETSKLAYCGGSAFEVDGLGRSNGKAFADIGSSRLYPWLSGRLL